MLLLLTLSLEEFTLIFLDFSHALVVLFVVPSKERHATLDAGEGVGIPALVAVSLDLLFFESCTTALTDKHGHLMFNLFLFR